LLGFEYLKSKLTFSTAIEERVVRIKARVVELTREGGHVTVSWHNWAGENGFSWQGRILDESVYQGAMGIICLTVVADMEERVGIGTSGRGKGIPKP